MIHLLERPTRAYVRAELLTNGRRPASSGRKSATIRLGDKSSKYRKAWSCRCSAASASARRERIFEAVIDKVDVKSLGELSRAEIEHDNPEIRRPTRYGPLPEPALQPRRHDRGRRHGESASSQILNGPVVQGFRGENDLF
jgi:hypothetical protein